MRESILDDPFFAAEGTVFGRTFFCPLEDTVEMEVVVTLSFNGNAIISRHFAAGAGRFEGKLANSTGISTLNIPFPGGNCMPAIYLDLHAC